MSAKRLFLTILLCAVVVMPAKAQLQTYGQEIPVTYTPPQATLAVNAPALNFAQTTGINTFTMSVNPTVAAKVAITNETSNGCLGTFFLAIAATSLSRATSYNSTPQAWQPVALVSAGSQLSTIVNFDIPALSTVYISSTAISGTKVSIQIVNATGGCASTNIDAVVTFITVATVSPLISNTTGVAGFGSNVQGVIPQAANGNPVLPVIAGAVQPAKNAGTNTLGVDNFSGFSTAMTNGLSQPILLGTAPTPSASTDRAFSATFATGGFTGVPTAPWVNLPSTSNTNIETLTSVNSGQKLVYQFSNSGAQTAATLFVEVTGNPTVRQNNNNSSFTTSTGGNTLSGSTILIFLAVTCTNSPGPCPVNSPPASSQGTTPRLLQSQGCITATPTTCTLYAYADGPTSAAAYSETFTAGALCVSCAAQYDTTIELSSPTPANPNTPAISLANTNPLFIPGEIDLGGITTESGGFSWSQTLTITANQQLALWNVQQHGVFQSCTVNERVTAASGTTPTLNSYLQDSGDQIGWNDHLSMPQATAAGSWEGVTPLFTGANLTATASSAVATTNQTLAAGSGIAGPLGPFGRIAFVVGGTTPSFTVNINVTCKY